MANILVTGGAGYVGSHVLRPLIEQGHRPIVLDDLSRGHRELATHHPQVQLVEGSLEDRHLLAQLLRERSTLLRQGRDLEGPAKLERRNQLLASALRLQSQRQDAQLELSNDRIGQRIGRIWDLQEQWLSGAISHYRTLLRLPPLTVHSPSLEALQQAECQLFEALAERLELWAEHWPEGRWLASPAQAPEALEAARQALESAEATVFADPIANAVLLSSSGGRRAITCHQLHDGWMSFERQWQAVP